MLNWAKKLIKEYARKTRENRINRRYGKVFYCACGEILNEGSECTEVNKEGVYLFTCSSCKLSNYFHFGISPSPVKVARKLSIHTDRNGEYVKITYTPVEVLV